MDKVQKMGIKQNQKIINNSMREGNIQPIHLGLKSQFSNISKGNYNNSFYQQDGSLTTSYDELIMVVAPQSQFEKSNYISWDEKLRFHSKKKAILLNSIHCMIHLPLLLGGMSQQ
eukprot:403346396